MGYSTLKAALDAVVRTNGQQQITGANLNGVMTQILQGVDIPNRSNPADTSGMEYLVLDKTKTFAEQVTGTNTIFEIRDNFDLGGNSVSLPAGSILKFNGGKVINGTIVGNETKILGNARFDCSFSGTFDVPSTRVSWFGNNKTAFLAAMDFCALTTGNHLDGENIEISFSGSVTFKARHNFNISNLNIRYTPTANGESMFVFDSETQYVGGNKYIENCRFECTTTSFSSVHCLNFKSWYNTTSARFVKISAKHFTGYVVVNQSYLQEAVFDTIKGISVGGFISFNPDLAYGENAGSSNILYFLNCGIDDGIIGADIPYIVDLHNMMTTNFVNFVAQGANSGATGTKALRLNEANALIGDVVLDTFWVEFTSDQSNCTKVDVVACTNLTLKHRCPLKINVSGNGANIKIQTESQYSFEYVLDNLSVTNPERTHILFDYGGNDTELDYTKIAKIKALYDLGICGKFSYHSQVNRTPLIPLENIEAQNEDGIGRYLQTTLNRQLAGTQGQKVECINGVNVLSFTIGDTAANISLRYPAFLPKRKIVYVDMIYRITTNLAVTAENKSTIVCKSSIFGPAGFKQGSQISPYTPVEGQEQGYSDGWQRRTYFVHATDAASALSNYFLTMRNTTIEFAKLSFKTMISIDDEDIYIDTNGNLARKNPSCDHYSLNALDAYSRNVYFNETIYNLIKNSDAFYVMNGQTYKAANGHVDLVSSEYRHSGTTSERPNFTGLSATWIKEFFAGWTYYDKTITKLLVWNGSAWVNVDGTALS